MAKSASLRAASIALALALATIVLLVVYGLVRGLVRGLIRGWIGLIDGHFNGRGSYGVHMVWGHVGGVGEARKSA